MNIIDILLKYAKKKDIAQFNQDFTRWQAENQPHVAAKLNHPYSVGKKSGVYPLIFAISLNDVFLVTRLVLAGANPNLCAEQGESSALLVAVELQYSLVVEALCRLGAEISAELMRYTLIHHHTHLPTIEVLCHHLATHPKYTTLFSENCVRILAFALVHENVDLQKLMAKLILAKPTADLIALMKMAIEKNSNYLFEKLIDKKIDLYAKVLLLNKEDILIGSTFLEYAWTFKRFNCVEKLLELGFDPNHRPESLNSHVSMRLIHRAGLYCPKAIPVLVKYGAIVDYVEGDGVSPLSLMVHSGNTESLRLLLECGANPNGNMFETCHPIEYACLRNKNFLAITKMLIGHVNFCFSVLFERGRVTDVAILNLLLNKGGFSLLDWMLKLKHLSTYQRELLLGFSLAFGAMMNNIHFIKEVMECYEKKHGREQTMMFLQFVIAFIQIGASLAEDKATAIARLENLLHQLTEKTAQRDVAISSSVLNSNFPYVKTQSMRSHLMTLGWQKKDFDKENEERKQQRKEHEKRIVIPAEKSKEKVYSWFEKKINSTFFQKVEGLCHGIETFVYIPEHRKTMHDGLRLFVKSRYNPKLVKPILGMKVVVNVRLFNKVEDVVVTHELKSNNTEDRLLLATFYSDDKKAKLLIAVDYIKDGLHTLGNKRAIIDSAATNAALDIHFPWLMLEDNGLKARV